jgi:hypothetical protein
MHSQISDVSYGCSVRLTDGSLMILGGMIKVRLRFISRITSDLHANDAPIIQGGFNNKPETDNPTFEFYPPKGNGLPIYSHFLHQALNSNLFPHTAALPNGLIFVAANRLAMLYNWKTNTERRLPSFPNGVRVNYPASAGAVLLPLTIQNNWTPEVLLCGGTKANVDGLATQLSSQYPASAQCMFILISVYPMTAS